MEKVGGKGKDKAWLNSMKEEEDPKGGDKEREMNPYWVMMLSCDELVLRGGNMVAFILYHNDLKECNGCAQEEKP
ncbi:hypothetical protein SESBI_45761 [Sesbania bispinosa]|nr:hypothetical protein SESBI_45761 [Sesbania bispinosa]